jgi:hypothetical protein
MKRNRVYSFKIEVPLTDTKAGEARSMTCFVYDEPNKDAALNRWFLDHARTARHAGARGSAKNLLASLKVTRFAKRTVTHG